MTTLCPLFFRAGSSLSSMRNFPEVWTSCSSICRESLKNYLISPNFSLQLNRLQEKSQRHHLKLLCDRVQGVLHQVRVVAASLQHHQHVLQLQRDVSFRRGGNVQHRWRGAEEVQRNETQSSGSAYVVRNESGIFGRSPQQTPTSSKTSAVRVQRIGGLGTTAACQQLKSDKAREAN